MFFEAPENVWIHSVPRLIFLLEGKQTGRFYRDGKIEEIEYSRPCCFFCSANGYLLTDVKTYPCRALSLSFMPNYIRAMHIDYVEGVAPPTDRDIYFHSSKPLDAGGMKIIEAIETLHHEGHQEVCKHLLKPLMEVAVKDLQAFAPSEIPNTLNLTDEIVAYLREHRDRSISREQLGRIFHISPGYISRIFHINLGKTFGEIQQSLRMEHAATLLQTTRLSINEIAERCGYNYTNYFIRRFVQDYGMTPRAFRSNQHVMNRDLPTSGNTNGSQTDE